MEFYTEEIPLRTSMRVELIDITSMVSGVLESSGIKEGILNIFSRHSTSAIFINENETRLLGDIESMLSGMVPSGGSYGHNVIDNNADSHLRAVLLGGSQTIPVVNGKMDLGTWQSIFFAELDGPRNRRIRVSVAGRP
ncbi:secondary thiamine-phosphate synthase enzyme YjbQ [Methanothermobacter sp.]|uniref:secondary thiamine-phosphate synthase enzyme YjbQ n=1 Tax=Methanothermobacter sp. TaxID=1884223 RepID=UPI00260BAEFA|nr:secondary thiamine-phosphate synthase enzyme YjbQ [Methanothermobacter sp.]MDI9618283.1 secondary thiamine-phosphate synthase enzyme YjbQ [Methanothermobacter sp.]